MTRQHVGAEGWRIGGESFYTLVPLFPLSFRRLGKIIRKGTRWGKLRKTHLHQGTRLRRASSMLCRPGAKMKVANEKTENLVLEVFPTGKPTIKVGKWGLASPNLREGLATRATQSVRLVTKPGTEGAGELNALPSEEQTTASGREI